MGGGVDERGPGSLETSKPTSFALTLKTAIKDEFGTSKEFAKKLEVSEGRVSQILGGEVVSPYTLDLILHCFGSYTNRKLIYEAWISVFAPSPIASDTSAPDQIEALLREANKFKAAGKARQFISTLESLLVDAPGARIKFMILEESVNTALYLGRTSKALALTDILFQSAQSSGDHGWIAKALYLRANVSRTMNPRNPQLIVKCHEEAVAYANAFAGGSAMCRLLSESLERDWALTVVLISKGKVAETVIDDATARLDRGIERTEDMGNRLLWLEAKVRLLLSNGNTFGAEDILERISDIRGDEPVDFSAKEQISQATLLLTRGQIEEAESILISALDECLKIDNLHHSKRIDSLLSKVLTARMFG